MAKTRFCDELEGKSKDWKKDIKESEMRLEKIIGENLNFKENLEKNYFQSTINLNRIKELDEKIKNLDRIFY